MTSASRNNCWYFLFRTLSFFRTWIMSLKFEAKYFFIDSIKNKASVNVFNWSSLKKLNSLCWVSRTKVLRIVDTIHDTELSDESSYNMLIVNNIFIGFSLTVWIWWHWYIVLNEFFLIRAKKQRTIFSFHLTYFFITVSWTSSYNEYLSQFEKRNWFNLNQ